MTSSENTEQAKRVCGACPSTCLCLFYQLIVCLVLCMQSDLLKGNILKCSPYFGNSPCNEMYIMPRSRIFNIFLKISTSISYSY